MSSVIGRRRFLFGSLIAALLPLPLGCGFLGTGVKHSDLYDPLIALRDQAARDAALAHAALSSTPRRARELSIVETTRTQHATILNDEIKREQALWKSADTAPRTADPADTPQSAQHADVLTALHTSAASTQNEAVAAHGYRAGLLGSIAASCSALEIVLS